MNSETRCVANLVYVKAACTKLNDNITAGVEPTLLWAEEECDRLIDRILLSTEPKKGRSWARVADRAVDHLRTLVDDLDQHEGMSVSNEEAYLHAFYTANLIVEKMRDTNKGLMFDDLCTALYTVQQALENRISEPRIDEILDKAVEYRDMIEHKFNQC